MFRGLCWNLIFLGTLTGASCAQNQTTTSPPLMAPKTLSPLEKRANDVVEKINAPKDFEGVFSSGFLTALPSNKLAEVFGGLTAQFGKAVRVKSVVPKNQYSGTISIEFEKNVVAVMSLNIDPASSLVTGLLITSTENGVASLEGVVDEMKKVSGETGLSIVQLDGNTLKPLVSYNADKQFAIGSTFKLYILAELVRGIEAGQRHWTDVVELNQASLPSGTLQNWPQGSPLTLHSLASFMISISDNTATDQLIETLGREPIEKMMATTGNSNPTRSYPFLKTLELFKIKGDPQADFASNYAAKSPADRRKLLASDVAAFSKDKIDLGFLAKPSHIDTLEWFASPNDLARVMNWLRLHSVAQGDKARGVLSINKALPETEASQWKYVGYKGGSETGVMSMTYLLQSKKGDWYVVSGSCNNDQAAVNEGAFASLMSKAVSLLRAKV